MEVRNSVDYKIDWQKTGELVQNPSGATIYEDRKHYFDMLRRLIIDLKNLGKDDIDDVFAKYNVYLVDIDDIKRVNIDEPKGA